MNLDTEPELESYDREVFRKALTVGREYGFPFNIKRIIWNLEQGDEITVETYRKGNPTHELWVTDKDVDNEAIAIELSSDEMYYLMPNDSLHPGSSWASEPWLRTSDGMESRGEIRWLRVDKLS